jgi:hypothetical protein
LKTVDGMAPIEAVGDAIAHILGAQEKRIGSKA